MNEIVVDFYHTFLERYAWIVDLTLFIDIEEERIGKSISILHKRHYIS